MRKRIKTVKGQIILIVIAFSVTAALLMAVLSLYLIYTFQRRIAVQSAEFNLQLVSSLIAQDLQELASLGTLCGGGSVWSASITDYFLADSNEKILGVYAYNGIFDAIDKNRAGLYVRRLIVVDSSGGKILQVDKYGSSSRPVTVYNIDMLNSLGLNEDSAWEALVSDPFYNTQDSKVIPFTCSVSHPEDGGRIGSVFLAANTTLITDKLKGYALTDGSELYLTLGGSHYLLSDGSFTPADFNFRITPGEVTGSAGPDTTVKAARDAKGERRILVTYPVQEGISLTHVLADMRFLPQLGAWTWLLAGLILLIILLGTAIMYSLDRTISRPVARLRRKIDAVSKGDFSPDPGIESDNELGQVGRGVNRLSRSVVALMETRIADEKKNRELEYRMLQSQINPHFIYNTLNSIKWMATLQSADGIAEMTTALSRLLKTVSKDLRKVVPLEDEFALLEDYMIIQKYRYGGNVTLIREIEDQALLKAQIPRFTLQPLVENAIFHGIEPKGAGRILIRVSRDGEAALVAITDNGVGIGAETLAGIFDDDENKSGMFGQLGLRNVNERLRYAFGEGFGLSVESEEGRYTTMSIRLPFENGGEGGGAPDGENKGRWTDWSSC